MYLGEHRYLEVPAAIKVLHVQMEATAHERFRREAHTIAHLQHPHIVRVLDFGVQDLSPFLVMEYMPGGTLRTRHPKGTRLSCEQVVHYVKQVAAALDYAHQHHVIHRDVKPENLLLNAQQEIVLSDFGIAVVQDTLESLSTPDQAGTPMYMAPEQIHRKPCPASDQYALGVLVYEWLCGEPPFRGSLFEVMNQHLHRAPPSLREQLPALASAVEQVVLKALAKEPEQRFERIVAFAAALEQALGLGQTAGADQPLLVRTVSPDPSVQHIGRGSQRPLVGREQERWHLHHLLLATEQRLQASSVTSTPSSLAPILSSRPAGVVLLGEAGIGKTRLAEEVSREAQRRGWVVAWSRACLQEQTIPYQLWIEALRHAIFQVREIEQEVSQHPLRYHPLTALLPELAKWLPKETMPP